MDSGDENVELLNAAIQRLIEERKKKRREFSGEDHDDNDDEQLLLYRLLSQLESLKAERALHKPVSSKEETCSNTDGGKEIKTDGNSGGEHDDIDKEEIVKELKKVEKQNSATHWLLSIIIVLTIAWQISEVSLVLKLKDGLCDRLRHPFRYLGDMLTGMLRGRQTRQGEDDEKLNHIEAPPLPPLKIPEMPHVELPDSSINGERQYH